MFICACGKSILRFLNKCVTGMAFFTVYCTGENCFPELEAFGFVTHAGHFNPANSQQDPIWMYLSL